ncbi:kinase-like domain-containing protein [Scheffersomyces coipomensis]|uniref:kinase-like domain-containing protein n=1 Tax=Scheffersomyces coipomensis TaxID=1788519 RepID=UPI00315C7E5D
MVDSGDTLTENNNNGQRNDNKELKIWLANSNCQSYYSKFVDNGITVDLLPELDSESLKELGIIKLGDRLKLEIAISNLKSEKLINSISVEDLYKIASLHLNQRQDVYTTKAVHGVIENPFDMSPSGDSTLLASSSGSSILPSGPQSQQSLLQQPSNSKDSSKNITFILQDGTTKKVNITGCFNAQSIKRKMLKKIGIKSQETEYDTYVHSSTNYNNNQTNTANATGNQYELNLLFDVELVTICYSPDRIEKNRILLCPRNEYPTELAIEASKKIIIKGEKYAHLRSLTSNNLSQYHIPDNRRKQPTLRSFFGQRPPSELISSNLAEYFPDTEQKELEQTIRNSVRYSVRLSRRFNLPPGMISTGSSNVSVNRRGSIMSNYQAAPGPPYRSSSISSGDQLGGGRRANSYIGRTVGDVMVNNIREIDEVVNPNDNSSIFSKPPSVNSGGAVPNASPSSNNYNNDAKSIISTTSSVFKNAKISVATSFADNGNNNNNRYSRIELLSVDSDSDDTDDVIGEYGDDDDVLSHGLGSLSGDVPKHWLKGARIGAGSFGTVYLGMNSFTGEVMAVKQVPLPKSNNGDSEEQQRLIQEQQREMSLLKELNHENIVRYFGASTDEENLNIFLEYVPGGSVQSMLQSYGPFEEPLIRNFIRQILIGLSYLHGEDIIHRDIKGANILIDIKGTVKIGDFGISKKVANIEDELEVQKKTGKRASLQGSVYWMAPEVVKQTAYTKKADIWSVGCLIIEMFTGKHPFPEFSQMQAIFKIGTHITPLIPEYCTQEAKDFLGQTFELDYKKRPDAVDLLGDSFLNPLIMSKQ